MCIRDSINDAAVSDQGAILEANYSGALTFTASMSSNIINVLATNTLNTTNDGTNRAATVKFLTRKWLG